MILVQREPGLDLETLAIRACTLEHLGQMHSRFEFDGLEDLRPFLDKLADRLVAAGAPGYLTRILLICQDDWILEEVRGRMAPGGLLSAYTAPHCWLEFGARIHQIAARARLFVAPGGTHAG